MKKSGRARATPESLALGRRLLEALERTGKTQSDLARELEVNRQTIQQLAAGYNADPGARRIFRIADALGINARWLVLGDGAMRDGADKKLEPAEWELIHLVRQLPRERQSEVIGFCRGMIGAQPARPSTSALHRFIEEMKPDEAKRLAEMLDLLARARNHSE